MLYLDSSALIKGYLQESGSLELKVKVREAAEAKDPVLTSFLSHAEIHTALGRKLRDGFLPATEYHWAVTRFESDWRVHLTRVELSQLVLDFIPDLVKRHPLKTSDAVQLASAVWAVSAFQTRGMQKPQRPIVFVTSDKQLRAAAEYEGFDVFDPEAGSSSRP